MMYQDDARGRIRHGPGHWAPLAEPGSFPGAPTDSKEETLAKKIAATIDDNIEAGQDAADWKIRGALASPYDEVVRHALRCRELIGTAWDALGELDKIHTRCQKLEREAERNAADERQQQLDIVERCRDCEHHGIPEESGEAVAAGEGYCKETDMLVVSDTPAVDQECGCFKAREEADDDHPRPDSDDGL